jgi:hypothetical protein
VSEALPPTQRVRHSSRDVRSIARSTGASRDEYDACVSSGLYDDLIASGLLVAHRDVGVSDFDG